MICWSERTSLSALLYEEDGFIPLDCSNLIGPHVIQCIVRQTLEA